MPHSVGSLPPGKRHSRLTTVRRGCCQVATRRDSWRSHVHRTYIAQRVQFFKIETANVWGRGGRPLVLSLGGLRGILSFEKESIPLYPCSAKRCSPRVTSAAASFALVRKREKRKQKAPAGRGEGFLLCCVCIFRREKITSGGVPLCKY